MAGDDFLDLDFDERLDFGAASSMEAAATAAVAAVRLRLTLTMSGFRDIVTHDIHVGIVTKQIPGWTNHDVLGDSLGVQQHSVV